jgi:hypothetical protein
LLIMPYPRKTLSQAFVLTVAVGSGGCWLGVTNNPPELRSCPDEQPSHGADCYDDGLSCGYLDECSQSVTASCDDGAWEVRTSGTCNPPPPTCPTNAPAHGEACDALGMSCSYITGDICDEWQVEASCTENGWEVEEWPTGSCNPPPAECPPVVPVAEGACEFQPDSFDGYPSYCPYPAQTPCGEVVIEAGCAYQSDGSVTWSVAVPACAATAEQCQIYDVDAACDADGGCAWRAPGCDVGDAPQVLEGCYPREDCALAGCGEWARAPSRATIRAATPTATLARPRPTCACPSRLDAPATRAR